MRDFVIDDLWTPELAEEAAKEEGIELGEKHWQVITGTRELIAMGREPTLAELSVTCDIPVGDIEQLFPGPHRSLLERLAGARELERREV